ncbi:competence type IV pilus minor pilin ComGG [Bacillus pinisoli]|uniref:competence type IV pilus minor pilin ComGG n=1 Tax=Bacillus pinisoli TaxID=2901866 RepID=UPI001FF305AE|nr:competence type IV pilus minor pilin ComGG [Bacillus pinisoli]
MTDIRFYKERFQINSLETLLQKSMVEVKQRTEQKKFTNTTLKYEEGKSVITFVDIAPNQKRITITVQTDSKRKASVVLYLDVIESKVTRWVEVR